MRIFVKEAVGYFTASAVALMVDMATLWALVRVFSWGYLAASSASFVSGATVAYVLSVKLAFKHHRLRNRRAEFIAFVLIGTAGLAINAGIISLAVGYFGLHYLLAKCVAAGFTFMCNFIVRRQILFVQHSAA